MKLKAFINHAINNKTSAYLMLLLLLNLGAVAAEPINLACVKLARWCNCAGNDSMLSASIIEPPAG